MLDLYDWQTWQGFYPVSFYRISDQPETLIAEAEMEVGVFPVCHMIPGIGIKMVLPDGGFCYSSDTSPCSIVTEMALGLEILIHEATGEGVGHSSPEQAGRIAEQASVKQLYLIHYPPGTNEDQWVASAKKEFSGEVILAKDLMTIEFPRESSQ